MKRTYIKEIVPQQECRISGWVEKVRDQKTMQFVVLKDTTGSIQITIEKEKLSQVAAQVSTLTRGSYVNFVGQAVKSEFVKMGGIEFIPSDIEIESIAEELPITVDSSQDLKLEYRWIDLRDDKKRLIFEIRTFIEAKMREYFLNNGFIEIHSPKISAQSSEGGAEVFQIQYYDQKAYLTQSPQFYKQMAMAAGFDKVFEVTPIYRAERSYTARHTAEAVCIDFEVAGVRSHHDIMDIEESWMIYVLNEVSKKYGTIIEETFGSKVLIPTKIPRLKLSEVFNIFKTVYGIDKPESEQLDLDPDGEKLICEYAKENFNSDFVFITDYPTKARAFYSKRQSEDSTHSLTFDMLYRGWELNSGAVRETDYKKLKSQIEDKGDRKSVV